MPQYYGIERTDDYLEHYGVKGMKWGVRKAIASGNTRALSRHYARASAKLAKLQNQARTGKGLGARRAAVGGLASAALSGAGTYALNRAQGVSRQTAGLYAAGAALGGGIGGAVMNAGKTTKYDKARAQMRADAWKNEMNSAFKGTKYAKGSKSSKRKSSDDDIGAGLNKLADRYDRNYAKARKNGASHAKAERYANRKANGPKMSSKQMRAYAQGMNKAAIRGSIIGGPVGNAISVARYARQNPEAYRQFNEQYKKMSVGDRMRVSYGMQPKGKKKRR